jgi:glycosyltransferase involved in cell wall biosynthesis
MDGIVLVGNPPFLPTGYGKQLHHMGQYLKDDYSVLHICDFGYDLAPFEFEGVKVAPVESKPGNLSNAYIEKTVSRWISQESIDKWIMIVLGDAHKWGDLFATFPSAVIAPIDSEYCLDSVLETLSQSIPVAMSSFGLEQLVKWGFNEAFLLPHVASKNLIAKSSAAIRSDRLWPTDPRHFTVGFWGDFTKRKSPKQIMEAWNQFSMGKDDVRLWIHHSNHPQMEKWAGWKFDAHITTIGEGWSDSRLSRYLKGLDALLHCSNQEGFGVLQIEAQMQGTQVINTDYGPMPDLNHRRELVVPIDGYREEKQYGLPDIPGIVVRLETLYSEWKSGNVRNPSKWAESFRPEVIFPKYLNPLVQYMFEHFYPPLIKVAPKNPKHIAIFSTYGVKCGIATYTQMLARSLVDSGFKVSILAEANQGGDIGASELRDDIYLEYCWNRDWHSGDSLLAAIERIQPDVIHVQHEPTMLRRFGNLWSSLRKSKSHIVTTLHTPDFTNNLVKEALLCSDGVFLHNKPLALELAGSIMAPVEYIPHGAAYIPPDTGARKRIGLPAGIPLLFHYGFPSKSKGTLNLLKAVKKVRESSPYFEIAIFAGEHSDSKQNQYTMECESLADEIDGVFYSKDFVSEERLDEFLNASDLIVFPYAGSGVNSTSGAVMRTLSAGKPIIATDEGRLRDIIGGIHGWKCAADDVDGLAQALKAALETYSSNKPQYAKMCESVKRMAEEYSWQNIALRHISSYLKVSSAWSFHHHSTLSPRPRGNAPLLVLQDKPTSTDSEVGEEE